MFISKGSTSNNGGVPFLLKHLAMELSSLYLLTVVFHCCDSSNGFMYGKLGIEPQSRQNYVLKEEVTVPTAKCSAITGP